MKFFAIAALFVAAAMAGPLERRTGGGDGGGSTPPPPYDACPGTLLSNLECCDVNVLGLVSINCAPPSAVPTSAEHFQELCNEDGKDAVCCVLPVLGQAVGCEPPAGT